MTTKDVYNYFFNKERDVYKAMGLCYFAYAWGLIFLKKEIAPFRFLKLSYGLFDPSVFASDSIGIRDRKVLNYLYFTWEKYRYYSGDELMQRIKHQQPYLNAKCTISKKDIKRFFRKLKYA